MIPKIIHYCWFGGNPLPNSAIKCINSWKKHFPDYEIKEWNESNYDVHKIPYIDEAYKSKKYAFVSDYARFDILYQYGGLYFDTDVEVVKSFDDILANGPFMGCEIDAPQIDVNPGVGIAAEPGMEVYRQVLEHYRKSYFIDSDGKMNLMTVVKRTTEILEKNGLENKTGIQIVDGIFIYPKEYFNPFNDNTGKLSKTKNTHSIHWYSKTWQTTKGKLRGYITRPFHRIFGEDCFKRIKNR